MTHSKSCFPCCISNISNSMPSTSFSARPCVRGFSGFSPVIMPLRGWRRRHKSLYKRSSFGNSPSNACFRKVLPEQWECKNHEINTMLHNWFYGLCNMKFYHSWDWPSSGAMILWVVSPWLHSFRITILSQSIFELFLHWSMSLLLGQCSILIQTSNFVCIYF